MPSHKDTIVKTRSFLAANVETILEHLSIRREDQKNDSDDLFGDASDDAISSGVNWKTAYPLLNPLEVLLNEKESLGLFVSGNPLGDFAEFAEWCRDSALRDDIYLVLFNKVRKIFTKKNLMMFAIEISTIDGDYEAIIFPKNALKYSPLLVEKELYWVKGKISEGQGKAKKEDVTVEKDSIDSLVASSDDEVGTVMEEERPEYEEKPKLIIDALTRFTDGILPLFVGENNSFSLNRQALLESIQWTNIRNNPQQFLNYVGVQENTQVEENQKNGVANKNIKILRLSKLLGAEKLQRVKEMLKTQPIPNGILVAVEVETNTEWKRAKGEFWVDPYLLQIEGIDVEIVG